MAAVAPVPNPSRCAGARWLTPAAVAAGVIAGAMIATAPLAQAKPISESQIKSDCDEIGGEYYTVVDDNGHRYSQCCVKDQYSDTGWWCQGYNDGNPMRAEPGKPAQPNTGLLPPVSVAPPTAVNPPPSPPRVPAPPATAANPG